MVAAPERDALREASYFVERLRPSTMPLAGLVLNRVQPPGCRTSTPPSGASAAAERLETRIGGTPPTAALLRMHADGMATLARGSATSPSGSPPLHRAVPVATVPALAEDVHDLDGPARVGDPLAERA